MSRAITHDSRQLIPHTCRQHVRLKIHTTRTRAGNPYPYLCVKLVTWLLEPLADQEMARVHRELSKLRSGTNAQ